MKHNPAYTYDKFSCHLTEAWHVLYNVKLYDKREKEWLLHEQFLKQRYWVFLYSMAWATLKWIIYWNVFFFFFHQDKNSFVVVSVVYLPKVYIPHYYHGVIVIQKTRVFEFSHIISFIIYLFYITHCHHGQGNWLFFQI